MDFWTFALTLITGVLTGGGIGGIILAINARRKARSEIAVNEAEAENKEADAEKKQAETSEIITRAAGEAVKLLQSQLCEMGKRIDALTTENEHLRETQARHEKEITELQDLFDVVLAGAHILHAQVVELHGEPKYKPPERRKR
jgi:chromosome segregation ATPase